MSALEEARELIEFLPSETIDQLAWLETRARKVAAACIKACEVLEKAAAQFESYAKGHRVKSWAGLTEKTIKDYAQKAATNEAMAAMCRAALSCSAPPEDKQGADTKL